MRSEENRRRAAEPRWPIVFAVGAVFFLLAILPERIRLVPVWIPFVIGILGILPIAAVSFASEKAKWLRVERTATLIFFMLMASGTLVSLAYLVSFMIRRSSEIHGVELLTSSIGVWINNVLMFALLYWQMDRGGPAARAEAAGPRPDWLFPQEGAPIEDLPPGWKPSFVDYLFLSFSTATAFSATDALPLTHRAKIMMMIESSISLVTIVVVAARAINVLGS